MAFGSLLALLDTPLNKAGRLRIFIQTKKGVLIKVDPKIRMPRTYKRFSGLFAQLLTKMKIKSYKKFSINFKIIKFFKKKYEKLFNSLYKQKLNSIILHLLENKIEINTVYDVGAFQGDWTKLLKKTSLKNSKFYLFEANNENEIYLKNSGHKYFINVLFKY